MARRGEEYVLFGGRYPKSLTAADRKAKADAESKALRAEGKTLAPVIIQGREIAATFWGRSWCKHLESFSDYENRLPRGRSYVRTGSVIDLEVGARHVRAKVQGSYAYEVSIEVAGLPAARWEEIVRRCSGRIDSVVELLAGKLSSAVMEVITDRDAGMFPSPREISLRCSCPDVAVMCKHVAAALYGVGARLDTQPELLFKLRGVDPGDLVSRASAMDVLAAASTTTAKVLDDSVLSELFGIDFDETPEPPETPKTPEARKPKARKRQRKK